MNRAVMRPFKINATKMQPLEKASNKKYFLRLSHKEAHKQSFTQPLLY